MMIFMAVIVAVYCVFDIEICIHTGHVDLSIMLTLANRTTLTIHTGNQRLLALEPWAFLLPTAECAVFFTITVFARVTGMGEWPCEKYEIAVIILSD